MDDKAFSKWSCKSREEYNYELGEHDIRRWYQRDIDQITHSTGFRKLQRKSQLLSEKDPRSRSRLIHTIEVSRIATEISEELGLSKELTEAICLGHDLGTSPYGYIGNSFLAKKAQGDFSHELVGFLILLWLSKKEVTSDTIKNQIENILECTSDAFPTILIDSSPFRLIVSKSTEKDTRGRNQYKYYVHHVSPEILDGILNHGSNGAPSTLEGQVVRFADNIAYLSQDIEDLFTTQIVNAMDFTKISRNPNKLVYQKEINGVVKNYEMTWLQIDSDPNLISLRDAFSFSRGKRIATLIKRFVEYNNKLLKNNVELDYIPSDILHKSIPKINCDKGLEFIINYIWAYIEKQYTKPLIETSNEIQKSKMEQLWVILHDEEFIERNTCFSGFINKISSNTLFKQFSHDWLIAYYISNLSWQEVDLIIDSYHERNYTFDLDLDVC